ncbi:DEAD/DEAH box helicase, partial [Streptomyces mirabilis]
VAGRWSLLPAREPDATVRAHALARTLLDRHGVVTRGAVAAEGVEGGFSAVYRVLSAFEDSGQARRGYVVEGLGAAQFAMDGAVDRLRAAANARDRGESLTAQDPRDSFPGDAFPAPAGFPDTPGRSHTNGFPEGRAPAHANGFPGGHDDPAHTHAFPDDLDLDATSPLGFPETEDSAFADDHGFASAPALSPNRFRARSSSRATSQAVVLAAADPANAYGAALSWPEPPTGAGHKPGRKAGSLVVLVDGELTLYMERGGKTLLAWPSDPDGSIMDDARLRAAAEALAAAALAGSLGTVTVERVNGASALTSPFGTLLEGAGFIATPRGLRLRA